MDCNELCSYPACRRKAAHRHHIVYDGSNKTEPLCDRHHREITKINIDHSGPGHKLFDRERRRLYREWCRGELKPNGNPNAEPWIDDWNSGR
jgi:hypothetical protein